MHGAPQGGASTFLSVASRVDVDDFFRYLGEDVTQVDDDDLQLVFQLAFSHPPVLSHRALGRAMSADQEPMGTPNVWNRERFLERADLQLEERQLTLLAASWSAAPVSVLLETTANISLPTPPCGASVLLGTTDMTNALRICHQTIHLERRVDQAGAVLLRLSLKILLGFQLGALLACHVVLFWLPALRKLSTRPRLTQRHGRSRKCRRHSAG